MNPDVTSFISQIKQEWQINTCNRLREIVQQAIPDVTERIQYGKPHFLQNGQYAAVIGPAKEWVSFTIFNAQSLEAPEGFFEAGSPPERKTIKIRRDQVIDYELLAKLIHQAAQSR